MSDQTITTDVVEALLRASAHIKRINEWVEAS
jgi:hypothetical protein